MTSDPLLSIVVTIVDGGEQLRAFLRAVRASVNPPPLDIVVPYDASIAETGAMAADFPEARFIDMGLIPTGRPIATEAGKHELYDRRRATGLAAAKGDIIGILEDRGRPRPDWARKIVEAHAKTGKNVVGGAVDCMEPVSLLNWAFYVSDFGRYGRPFETGPVEWVTDVNVSYSRKALEMTRHLWKERYNEPVVNWFLLEQGEELILSNEIVVEHIRPPATLRMLLPERFHWGRLFGWIRANHFTPGQRLFYTLMGPIIPPRLWVRHLMTQFRKGKGGRYLLALPYVMILTSAWTAGEVWGYITRKP